MARAGLRELGSNTVKSTRYNYLLRAHGARFRIVCDEVSRQITSALDSEHRCGPNSFSAERTLMSGMI